jgi:hypothetical protein
MFFEILDKLLYYFRRIMTAYFLIYAIVYRMSGDTHLADIYSLAFFGWMQTILLEDK